MVQWAIIDITKYSKPQWSGALGGNLIFTSWGPLGQLDITNCVDRQLLQNAATLITKSVSYYKMRKLLQNASVITKCLSCKSGSRAWNKF